MPKLRELFPEYNDLSDATLSDRLYAKAGLLPNKSSSPKPWTMLGHAAGIAFGVPILALLAGISLSWAVAGFRAAKP